MVLKLFQELRKVMSLFFNMLSSLVIAFLPRSKCLLISWLQLPSAVVLEPKKIKSLTVSIAYPSICHEVMKLDAMILVFWMLSFKTPFFTPLFHFYQEALQFLFAFSHLHMWGYWYFSWQSWFQLVLHTARRFAWCTLHIKESVKVKVTSDSLQPHGLYCLWNSLGQNTGVDSLFLLQGIFPTQELNPGLPHCRQILYQISHKGSPRMLVSVAGIPSPADFPDPGIIPGSPALQAVSLPTELSGMPTLHIS